MKRFGRNSFRKGEILRFATRAVATGRGTKFSSLARVNRAEVSARLRFLRRLPRQPHWILMGALAESTSHPTGQLNAGLSELAAKMIGSRESLLPPPLSAAIDQVQLARLIFKRRCMHSEQPDMRALAPVLPE